MSHYSVLLKVMDINQTLRIIQVKQTKKVGHSSRIPFDSVKNRIAYENAIITTLIVSFFGPVLNMN